MATCPIDAPKTPCKSSAHELRGAGLKESYARRRGPAKRGLTESGAATRPRQLTAVTLERRRELLRMGSRELVGAAVERPTRAMAAIAAEAALTVQSAAFSPKRQRASDGRGGCCSDAAEASRPFPRPIVAHIAGVKETAKGPGGRLASRQQSHLYGATTRWAGSFRRWRRS